MTLGRKARWIIVGVLGLVLLTPVWGFELLYLYGLREEELPEAPQEGVSPLLLDALWLASGEEPNAGVRMLWAGNYFQSPREEPEHASRGRHAVQRVASLLVRQTPGRNLRTLEYHLAVGAVTVWLSRHASESELKRYLADRESFGRGANGVEKAAAAYFGKDSSKLTIAQIAILAGLNQNPSILDPACSPERAVKRRDFILTRLRDVGAITPEEFTAAMGEPLSVIPIPVPCR